MSRLQVIIGIVLVVCLGIGSFVGGTYFGAYRGMEILMNISAQSYFEKRSVHSLIIMPSVRYLDNGEVDKAIPLLRSQVDFLIQEVASFEPYLDRESWVLACNLLKTEAAHRESHAKLYADRGYSFIATNTILQHWRGAKCDEDISQSCPAVKFAMRSNNSRFLTT